MRETKTSSGAHEESIDRKLLMLSFFGSSTESNQHFECKEDKNMKHNLKKGEANLLNKIRSGVGAREQAACKRASWRSFHNCRR